MRYSLVVVLHGAGERGNDNAKNVKYTEYLGVMHNSWINAFAGPGLLPWLF